MVPYLTKFQEFGCGVTFKGYGFCMRCHAHFYEDVLDIMSTTNKRWQSKNVKPTNAPTISFDLGNTWWERLTLRNCLEEFLNG
jgi:hypothetical protein